jgi:hypothetical protein
MLSRRRVLETLLPSCLAAGCLSNFGRGTNRVALTVHEPDTEVVGVEPEIVPRSDAAKFLIVGAMYVGSSNCNRVVLDGVQWEAKALRIRLGVGRQTDAPSSCTMDESADVYEITVRGASSLETVIVENTKRGDRWEQRVPDAR